MIIELFGLPGAGKTTLAHALESEGAIVVTVPSRVRLLLDTLHFELLHPVASARLAYAAVAHAPHGMRYALYVNGYLQSAAKWMAAKRIARAGGTAVIDQGFAQLIVSLSDSSDALIRALPAPDVLVFVEAPAQVRRERMHARGRTPRAEFGIDVAEAWDAKAATAIDAALPILSSRGTQLVRVNGEHDMKTELRTLTERGVILRI